MTTGFSISEAMATPVRVIRRHPLAVYLWGLAITGFSVLSIVLTFAFLSDLPLAAGASADPETLNKMMAFNGLSMLLNVGQMVLAVVVWAATIRATYLIGRPDKSFFLRLGMDELRLAVVGIALFLGTWIAVCVLVAVGALTAVVIWQSSPGAAIGFGAIMMLALFVLVAVAMARLSLIAPASILQKDFAFVEGWRLGKKRTLPLLGLLLCTWIIYVLLNAVVGGAAFIGLMATGAMAGFSHLDPELMTFGEFMPSLGVGISLFIFAVGPGAFLYGAVMTLLSAPFASACRQLLDTAPQDAEAVIG